MQLVPIFVGTNPDEGGLWAINYPEKPDEFDRLFDQWHDMEYLERFFHDNIHDLPPSMRHNPHQAIQNLISEVMEEANDLEDALIELVHGGFKKNGKNLQQLFKPLDNRVYELIPLQKSKASMKTKKRPNPKLRIYAIRLAPNLYIITGGAIKLTHTMGERPHLVEELQKIERVRQWLKDEGIFEQEDL